MAQSFLTLRSLLRAFPRRTSVPTWPKGELSRSSIRRLSCNVPRPSAQSAAIDSEVFLDPITDRDSGLVSVDKFLSTLSESGLRATDCRLSETVENIRKHVGAEAGLDKKTFLKAVSPSLPLVARALSRQLVIPDFPAFTRDVDAIYCRCKSNTGGQVASYIPQLALFSPDLWGVSVCTVDGQRYSIGDVAAPFTIQSCSKPITYGIALEKLGEKLVHKYVGREPSGRNFNALVLDHNEQPHNPMINSGAIVVCSLLQSLVCPEMTPEEKFELITSYFRQLAGGDHVGFDESVYLSEREAGDRNYALGYYMREHECFPEKKRETNLQQCLDLYFKCCSLAVTCESTAVMAATLANGGKCPTTGQEVFSGAVMRAMMTLMHSCGMYDYSGEFAFSVGVPAKSGVSGSLLLVVPNLMGMCLYSPPLDTLGNSVRGVQFCRELVSQYCIHCYDRMELPGGGKKDARRCPRQQPHCGVER